MMSRIRPRAWALLALAPPFSLSASLARAAEQSIIRNPGEHPRYAFEAEPEAIVLFDRSLGDGPGAGFRGSIPLADNGFVSTINDSPAISFGVSHSPLLVRAPLYTTAVVQWNFWMTTHLSLLGEAGFFLVLADGDRNAYVRPAFMGGARWHFNERVALTARVSLPNSPALGVGVSFFF